VNVLDKGFVKIFDYMGYDRAVIASARVSNGVTWEEASKGEEADQKLINYLMRNRHGSPFEHALFTFHVKCPIFVAREWQRHRIGSYNEISGRYTEFKPQFYIPLAFRQPSSSNKQGSEFLEDSQADEWLEVQFSQWCGKAYDQYKYLLNMGLAKEMARMVLPINLYTEFYWTVNARSLMNFLSLRQSNDAQWEIRQYALAIKDMFKEVMPMTYGAWERNEYLAP
jgi:thymidylate synthase (FAD)